VVVCAQLKAWLKVSHSGGRKQPGHRWCHESSMAAFVAMIAGKGCHDRAFWVDELLNCALEWWRIPCVPHSQAAGIAASGLRPLWAPVSLWAPVFVWQCPNLGDVKPGSTVLKMLQCVSKLHLFLFQPPLVSTSGEATGCSQCDATLDVP